MSAPRSMFVFDPSIDPAGFARDCVDWGIDTPILSPALLADGAMAGALAARGLDVWLNLPVFHDPGYLEQHPDRYTITSRGRRAVEDWLHFACPSREETVEHVAATARRLLYRLQPTVVSLDFIRHFVFWERVDLDGPADAIEDGCYCAACLTAFRAFSGERVGDDPVAELRGPLRKPWADWKCRRIAEVAERLFAEVRAACPGARLAIKTLPWRESDLAGAIRAAAGQDVPRLSRAVDLVAPMAFTHMLGRTPAWKRDLLAHVGTVTGRPVLSYVQAGAVYRPEPIPPEDFAAELLAALRPEYAGVAVFHYEQLAADPARAEILRRLLRP